MELRALLIGGVVPAILLGSGTVLMKLSLRNGISLPLYLVVVGSAVLLYGTVATFFSEAKTITASSAGFALGMGLAWSTAVFCMSYGMSVLKLPVSIIAPLTNSNALIAVALGAIVLGEWKDLNFTKVICGTIFIVVGASIVSTAVEKLGQ
jgi:transporter family protein